MGNVTISQNSQNLLRIDRRFQITDYGQKTGNYGLYKIPALAAPTSNHAIHIIIADLNVHGVIHIFGHIIDESANHRTAARES